jgi:hypothetical protein
MTAANKIAFPEHLVEGLKARIQTLDKLAVGDSMLAQHARKVAEWWALVDMEAFRVEED